MDTFARYAAEMYCHCLKGSILFDFAVGGMAMVIGTVVHDGDWDAISAFFNL